mmetsp:Transcript_15097/g.23343  ORF Transcript_15097/g.23343 Transcript_15097/m.23343 type:complete len:234 (-) Transcript_15097:834-1535(-)
MLNLDGRRLNFLLRARSAAAVTAQEKASLPLQESGVLGQTSQLALAVLFGVVVLEFEVQLHILLLNVLHELTDLLAVLARDRPNYFVVLRPNLVVQDLVGSVDGHRVLAHGFLDGEQLKPLLLGGLVYFLGLQIGSLDGLVLFLLRGLLHLDLLLAQLFSLGLLLLVGVEARVEARVAELALVLFLDLLQVHFCGLLPRVVVEPLQFLALGELVENAAEDFVLNELGPVEASD